MAAAPRPDWRAWLCSEACLPWLAGQARRIADRADGLRLPASLWPHPPLRELDDAQRREVVEEVAHEFWMFLRAITDRESPVPPLPPELGCGEENAHLAAAYFRTAYLNRLLGMARKKDAGLYRHLYRRLREVISRRPRLHPAPHHGLLLYSLEEGGEPLLCLEGLVAEPYRRWSSPLGLVSEQSLLAFRRADLEALAEHFWREAVSRLGRACRLPVRELGVFAAEHYAALQPPRLEALQEAIAAPEVSAAAGRPGAQWALAARMVSTWPQLRRRVFCLALGGERPTLAEIAERAGLSGASHAKYHLDAACRDLAEHCAGWPGAVPSFEDRGFWLEYLQCVAEVCTNSLGERETGQSPPTPNPEADGET